MQGFAGLAPLDQYSRCGCKPARLCYARATMRLTWVYRYPSSLVPGYRYRTDLEEPPVSLPG